MAGDVRGKRVLDVGCASGGLSEAFAERGARVVGIDLNPRLIERARERLGSRAEFRVEGGVPCRRHRLPAVLPRGGDVRSRGRVARAPLPCRLAAAASRVCPRPAARRRAPDLHAPSDPGRDDRDPARSLLRDGAAQRYLAEGRAGVPGALLPSSDQRDRRRARRRGLSHRAHPRARP
jgi:SAM-dependent methyltransferase